LRQLATHRLMELSAGGRLHGSPCGRTRRKGRIGRLGLSGWPWACCDCGGATLPTEHRYRRPKSAGVQLSLYSVALALGRVERRDQKRTRFSQFDFLFAWLTCGVEVISFSSRATRCDKSNRSTA